MSATSVRRLPAFIQLTLAGRRSLCVRLLMLSIITTLLAACGDSTEPPEIEFTEAEREFIEDADPLLVGADPEYPPIDFLQDGEHVGIMPDVIKLIADRTGLEFEYFDGESWSVI